MNSYDDQADEIEAPPAPNPGIETAREAIRPFSVLCEPPVESPITAMTDAHRAEVEKVLFGNEKPEHEFGQTMPPASGDACSQQGDTARTPEQIAEDHKWRRREAVALTVQNHQGRGVPAELLIDEAKIILAFIESGDVPDYSA